MCVCVCVCVCRERELTPLFILFQRLALLAGEPRSSIMLAPYPKPSTVSLWENAEAEAAMELVQVRYIYQLSVVLGFVFRHLLQYRLP